MVLFLTAECPVAILRRRCSPRPCRCGRSLEASSSSRCRLRCCHRKASFPLRGARACVPLERTCRCVLTPTPCGVAKCVRLSGQEGAAQVRPVPRVPPQWDAPSCGKLQSGDARLGHCSQGGNLPCGERAHRAPKARRGSACCASGAGAGRSVTTAPFVQRERGLRVSASMGMLCGRSAHVGGGAQVCHSPRRLPRRGDAVGARDANRTRRRRGALCGL